MITENAVHAAATTLCECVGSPASVSRMRTLVPEAGITTTHREVRQVPRVRQAGSKVQVGNDGREQQQLPMGTQQPQPRSWGLSVSRPRTVQRRPPHTSAKPQ
jgi:hypothetical protein